MIEVSEEEEGFFVVNWSIDNFSCWSSKIHDNVMSTEGFELLSGVQMKLELYPGGQSGQDEHLLVRFNDIVGSFYGDLSFLSSDGYLFWKQQVIGDENESYVLELPPGPKFDEVVSHIRKKEDRLILRFRLKFLIEQIEGEEKEGYAVYYIRSIIEVSETSLKISLLSLVEGDDDEPFMDIKYLSSDDKMKTIGLGILHRSKFKKIGIFLNTSGYDPDVSFILFKFTSDLENFRVLTSMCVLNNDDSVLRTEENDNIFQFQQKWVFSNSLSREEVTEKASSVILNLKVIPGKGFKHLSGHLSCYSKTFTLLSKRPNACISNQTDNSVAVLTSELMCLYQDQDFSDFQLKCGDVSIPVHKNILSARSPVFKTMLSCDMKEAASGCMDIVDLDPSTLGLFLTYLYTGAVEDLQSESALKLYYAADKYQVTTLKRECADFLSANVSISNVCDILSLADKHQNETLTDVAHDFIIKYNSDVLGSEKWQSFLLSEPVLAAKTLTLLFQRRKN